MRACWILAVGLAGCGFQVTPPGSGPSDDAGGLDGAPGIVDAADAEMPGDDARPMVDAGWSANDCPSTYVTVGTLPSRYRLLLDTESVIDQHDTCVADGAHLAVVDTATEASALRTFIDGTNNIPTVSGLTLVLIGGVQRLDQPTRNAGWLSATGAFDGSFWQTGEPNDSGGGENNAEQFAAIWRGSNLLADVPDIDLPALCECDGLAITNEYKQVLDDVADDD